LEAKTAFVAVTIILEFALTTESLLVKVEVVTPASISAPVTIETSKLSNVASVTSTIATASEKVTSFDVNSAVVVPTKTVMLS